jgi:osmotically inducible protein OsmC
MHPSMFKRTSTATWKGTGLEGTGALTMQSGVFREQPYSFKTRFQSEDGKAGTNPEELLAASHAGCFAMALSFILTGAGHPPAALDVDAVVTMKSEGVHWSVDNVALKLKGNVPGIDAAKFQELAEQAKQGCPISKALSVPISLDAKLVG